MLPRHHLLKVHFKAINICLQQTHMFDYAAKALGATSKDTSDWLPTCKKIFLKDLRTLVNKNNKRNRKRERKKNKKKKKEKICQNRAPHCSNMLAVICIWVYTVVMVSEIINFLQTSWKAKDFYRVKGWNTNSPFTGCLRAAGRQR